jgi:hypothetical protein
MASTPVMFQVPVEMLAAMDAYCDQQKISRAAMMRIAIADKIGYNLPSKDRQSSEQRKEAQKARNKEHREAIQKIMAAFRRGERAEDIAALAKSLGINPEDV